MRKEQENIIKNEIERQLEIANKYALERRKWDKNNFQLIGAYHLGRKEALGDIKRYF